METSSVKASDRWSYNSTQREGVSVGESFTLPHSLTPHPTSSLTPEKKFQEAGIFFLQRSRTADILHHNPATTEPGKLGV
jgi:hypothetical protein